MAVLVFQGEEHELKDGRNVIGKLKSSCDVVLDGATVADTHATLELLHDGAILTDSGSQFGTYFNGERLKQPQRVVHGDTIKFGDAGHEYKFDMTSTPSVAKSLASSFRDSLAPMFSNSVAASISSQKGRGPLRNSNVFASYQDERSTDAALRDMVERQLHRRSQSKSTTAPPLSPTQRNYIERQKLRLSQKMRDVNNVMLGYSAISDTYMASWNMNGRDHLDDDIPDEDDDELPETLEKAPLVIAKTKSPSPPPVVQSAPVVVRPTDAVNDSDDDDDDDDLPQTVEQQPPPFDSKPTPSVAYKKPVRSDAAQRRLDALIQTHRVASMTRAWNEWTRAIALRKRTDQMRRQRAAATRIQRFVKGVALRNCVARRAQQRNEQREQREHMSRVVQLVRRQHFRLAMARWRSNAWDFAVDMLRDQIADRCRRRHAITRTFRQWKTTWSSLSCRHETLSRVLRHVMSRSQLRAFVKWRAWRLECEAQTALAKAQDEQTKHKQLVQAMAAQAQAEATAWSDQAKETTQHLQREAALQEQVAQLTAQVQKWTSIVKSDAGAQTDSKADARTALLSHTLLKTVVGEVKEKNLRAVIDSLEGDLNASQEREARLRDEYKQLLETMVRHTSQLDEAQKALKQHQATIDDQAKALSAMETAHDEAKQAALDKESSLRSRIDELQVATADMQRREDLKKSMESKTQQQTIQLMEDACKREAALKAKVDALEGAARQREADQMKLVLAHEVETNDLTNKCRQLQATVDKFESERAMPREEPPPFDQPAPRQPSPRQNAALAQDLETHKKMLELAEMKLMAASSQLQAKEAAERRLADAELQVHMQFNAHVETFLKGLVTKYDLRLLRVGGELDVVMAQSEKDVKAAQFRGASNLVAYVQEERLMQFKELSELHDHVLQLRGAALTSPTPPSSVPRDRTTTLTQNGKFLYDMLLQRLTRLHQLHDSMAHQAAALGPGVQDTKKLDYAKFLAQTMYSRQVDFVDQATSALLQIARLQTHLESHRLT